MKRVCAWCEPNNKELDTSHGICETHVFAMIFAVGLEIEHAKREELYADSREFERKQFNYQKLDNRI